MILPEPRFIPFLISILGQSRIMQSSLISQVVRQVIHEAKQSKLEERDYRLGRVRSVGDQVHNLCDKSNLQPLSE